jgi:hypothetical protein
MALAQIVQTTQGVPATYWKVASVLFNLDGSCTLRLDGFFDEAARRANYESMKQFSYTVPSGELSTVFPSGFSLTAAYDYVKTQTEFSFGSVDLC